MRRLGALFIVFSFVLSALSWGARLAARADAPDAGAPPKKSEASYTPRPSAQGKEARALHIDAPAGAEVVRIPIEGTIDLGLAALVRRALEANPKAAAILLDINTLGGRVDAAIQIRDALLASKVKTIAFVHPRAISAGALISLACDFIVVSNGASIGAATPIQLGEGGAEPVDEKMVSYFRTEMRATAEAKGRRGDIAEAMVDASVAIEGLDPAGKLLTLDADAALEWRMADARADSVEALLDQLGLAKNPVRDVDENWAEKLVRFLTDPVVSGLLMSLGTLGLLIELYSPGFGLPGIVGILSLCLFFGGHLLVNLAGLEELILFTVGLGLLALEVLVIPGFGVAGILGIVCLLAALVLTLVGLPLHVTFSTGAWAEPLVRVLSAMVLTVLGLFVALRFLPNTGPGRRLVLQTATTRSGGFTASQGEERYLDREGVAESDLRPAGMARFDDDRVDVVSEGAYIARGTRVRVVLVEGPRVVVRPVRDAEHA